MIALDLLWWLGWSWVLVCAAVPFAAVAWLGLIPALVVGGILAPWTTLAGLTLLRRLVPASEPGRFQMFTDAGSVCWAIQSWAPSVYLALFQPLFFQSSGFARLALRALGARLGSGAQVALVGCGPNGRRTTRRGHRRTARRAWRGGGDSLARIGGTTDPARGGLVVLQLSAAPYR